MSKIEDSSKIQLNSRAVLAVIRVVMRGLIGSAGSTEAASGRFKPGQVCVEQAISHALGFDWEGDKPKCVGPAVNTYKIYLNDRYGWSGSMARAKGMVRVAIAQLGSNKLDQGEFVRGLVKKLGIRDAKYIEDYIEDSAWDSATESIVEHYLAEHDGGDTTLMRMADAAADVLIEMKSPGAKYLYLLDDPMLNTWLQDESEPALPYRGKPYKTREEEYSYA